MFPGPPTHHPDSGGGEATPLRSQAPYPENKGVCKREEAAAPCRDPGQGVGGREGHYGAAGKDPAPLQPWA